MINEINYIFKLKYKDKIYLVHEFWSIYYVQVFLNDLHIETRLYTREQLNKEFNLQR